MASVINPGNIVVPLSAVLDQLRGKLTSVEVDALLAAVVGRRQAQVGPGDLITADLVNQILLDLQNLNLRVAALSGGAGGVRNSAAIATLHDAWSFYAALAKGGEFLPTATSAEALQSAAQITSYLMDVANTALSGGALGYSGDTTSLLDAFRRLYLRQHDVVVLFLAPIPGIPDSSTHRRFANLLSPILEQTSSLGGLSLREALDAQDLDAAVAAQNRVNGMVRDQGGDVTTGNLEVIYRGAVGNTETLVIGATQPVLYRFGVANRTNRDLEVRLTAEFLPPRQNWTQLSVVNTNGAAVDRLPLVPFNPANPNDPRATQEVRVAAMTPAGAANGDTGILQLSAFVPAPISRRGVATRQLEVRNNPVNQTPGVVAYRPGTPVLSGNPAQLQVLTPFTIGFSFGFSALQGPSSRGMRFRIDATAPANPDTSFFFEFGPADAQINAGASSAIRKISEQFTMADGNIRTSTVTVTPLAGSTGQSLTFTATVESATDGISVMSQPITLAVS